ncbi:MATE efflux family protein, partial [gut metagenome]
MSKLAPPKTSFKALFTLAGPIFVANIAIIGGGTIDTIMAGQLGKDHLAAVALGLAATICVLMGLVGILQSLSPIAGHHFGAHQYEKVGEELQQNLWLATGLCLIGVPLLLYTDLWISLGQVQGEVAEMAS